MNSSRGGCDQCDDNNDIVSPLFRQLETLEPPAFFHQMRLKNIYRTERAVNYRRPEGEALMLSLKHGSITEITEATARGPPAGPMLSSFP